MVNSYLSISKESRGLFKDRGSKFLSFAIPVNNEEEIKSRIEELKKEYHDARHHCYAWKIGTDNHETRANDDGEPSYSAGKPILNQIEKFDLTNILIVVVRYFGGTKLGVGGLINAYRTASEDAILNARIIKRKVQLNYLLTFEYPAMNDVMKLVKDFDIYTYDQSFELECSLKMTLDLELKETIESRLSLIACTFEEMEE